MNLLLLAIAPVFMIIIYMYYKDKYEKEPKRLLLYTFLLGAIISILITTILYVLTDLVLPLNESTLFQLFIKAFLVVGLIEEFSKYVIVRYFAQPKKEFNEPFDGIMYAVVASLGFAATENVIYVLLSMLKRKDSPILTHG